MDEVNITVGPEAGPENRPASRMPNRKYAYFRDDQVVFLLKHGENLLPTQLRAFDSAVAAAVRDLQSRSIEKPSEVISFPELTGQEMEQVNDLVAKGDLTRDEADQITSAFSIIKYDLNDDKKDPANLLRLVQDLPQNLEEQFKKDEIKKDMQGITVEGTLPNWLSSVAAQGGGTGGPGGKPSPYYGSRKNAPYFLDIVAHLKEKNIYGDGEGVCVAILDTAPSAQALVSAYKEWPDHPLISTLLGPQGKLHLHPASYDDLWRMNCTSLNDHDYKMTDHGLFIAGIIHSIVPEAEIHLIEVLNQYGVGDYMSFVQGLYKVYTEEIYKPDCQLVINCSWMLEFPLEDRHSRHKNKKDDPDEEFVRRILELSSELDQSLLFTLQALFNRFYSLGRQAMAAAGNDGKKEDTDGVKARYPAALKRVQGVGALKSIEKGENEKYIASVFSNLSDTPDKKGIMTFGGEEGEGKGVLGLYIGEFPGCCRNESKWAWWSGTSFATPILTGTVASVLSNNTLNTQEALKKLYATPGGGFKLIEDGKARKQEDAMPVTQS